MAEPRTVRERCRAKLNLFLDVTGRRADGFHELVTVFHEIDLADDLVVTVGGGAPGALAFALDPPVPDVPNDTSNLALRAAGFLWSRAGADAALSVTLTKRIPVGGGLGGGSADAAGALRAVNAALGLGLSGDDLRAAAERLGSDVPFLVEGGSALARGRGEQMLPVPSKPMDFLLLVPTFPLATAAVYQALPRDLPPPRDPRPTLAALAAGDAKALGLACENALFEGARRVDPRIDDVMAAARAALGPCVHLTGSGSTLFAPWIEGEPLPDLRGVPHLRDVVRTRSRTT
ncbi:MAG: 4-(cytidine 5'-diphospho)-2-C-methyl-D-erythritol kinase [Planctomycetes bacterium]|nr:4-(cytidine 5'-diphospho)-2-C-methyl-D-erythritol kinase [Planctomycetota bacterium]